MPHLHTFLLNLLEIIFWVRINTLVIKTPYSLCIDKPLLRDELLLLLLQFSHYITPLLLLHHFPPPSLILLDLHIKFNLL